MSLRIRRGTDAQRSGITFDMGEIVWTTDGQQLWVGDGLTQGGSPVVGANVAGFGLAYDPTTRRLEVAGLSADNITNGVNNKFFATELAQDAAASLFITGTHSNISFVYDDDLGKINATVTLDGVGLTDIVADTSPQLGGDLDLNLNDITGIGNIDFTGSFSNGTLTISTNNIQSSSAELSFGTITEPVRLLINSVREDDSLTIAAESTLASGPNLSFYSVKGSLSLPQVLTVGDTLGQIRFQGLQNTPVGIIQAPLVTINSVLTVEGDGASILPRGKLQFLISNGPNPADASIAEFNKEGVFSAPIIQPGSYTTIQRDALTPAAGMMIYNTTDNKFQGYDSSGWVNLN